MYTHIYNMEITLGKPKTQACVAAGRVEQVLVKVALGAGVTFAKAPDCKVGIY